MRPVHHDSNGYADTDGGTLIRCSTRRLLTGDIREFRSLAR